MKQGQDIATLIGELEYQQDNHRDFLVNTTHLRIAPTLDTPFGELLFKLPGQRTERYEMSEHMLGQVSSYAGVPLGLVKTMLLGSEKEAVAITKLLTVRLQENESIRMIRTVGRFWGNWYARAFLSDRYKEIDNFSIVENLLPLVKENPALKIVSCNVSETKLYIKIINDKMKAEVEVGDIVKSGVVISNSEVGAGAFRVEPLIYRLACKNGATMSEGSSLRKNHIGKKHKGMGHSWEVNPEQSENTLNFLARAKEIVRDVLADDKLFSEVVAKLAITKAEEITGDVPEVMKVIGKRYSFSVAEIEAATKEINKTGDFTQFGAINAITRFAGTEKKLSYDRATFFESVGGQIIDMPKPLWRQIAKTKGDTSNVSNKTSA